MIVLGKKYRAPLCRRHRSSIQSGMALQRNIPGISAISSTNRFTGHNLVSASISILCQISSHKLLPLFSIKYSNLILGRIY